MSFGRPEPSYYYKWPTKEKPDALYKLTSLWLEQGPTKRIVERQTYNFLEWLGDVGGLFDGLLMILSVLMQPFAKYALRMVLMDSMLGQ